MDTLLQKNISLRTCNSMQHHQTPQVPHSRTERFLKWILSSGITSWRLLVLLRCTFYYLPVSITYLRNTFIACFLLKCYINKINLKLETAVVAPSSKEFGLCLILVLM